MHTDVTVKRQVSPTLQNDKEFQGRALTVNVAKPREERGGSARGFGGGGRREFSGSRNRY